MLQMLEEFIGITDETLPQILPPFREIDEQIDFIPGDSLPNLSHYRLSPREATHYLAEPGR